ncbi:unnamed protein product (macronuclear) [Paramecium tetraurelia]|uniref:Uncharacterized protein n=1 Tax=Paramecium tetraurelia TaxID=5888 RepID=A0D1X1_PARTE|nr:uncharacterized protein GSPATT00012563001 [Paramecium tetraurelia]CAK77038.1 unnamed protein product [Paramecium tetraurelia]|eukprot:XP_001444435.1 hypothetical protein (macronuclear) [Paramecium tetraurelia strain d4-2]
MQDEKTLRQYEIGAKVKNFIPQITNYLKILQDLEFIPSDGTKLIKRISLPQNQAKSDKQYQFHGTRNSMITLLMI